MALNGGLQWRPLGSCDDSRVFQNIVCDRTVATNTYRQSGEAEFLEDKETGYCRE
jgi:hypothetical protein